jgi:hypothetical protein
MASLSSTIFLGSFHPNDGDLVPTHTIEIYEGGSIALLIRDLRPIEKNHLLTSVAPEEVVSALLYLIATTLDTTISSSTPPPTETDFSTVEQKEISKRTDEARALRLGLLATLLPGATLRRDDLIALEYEMQICELTYGRVFNQWRDRLEITDYAVTEKPELSN